MQMSSDQVVAFSKSSAGTTFCSGQSRKVFKKEIIHHDQEVILIKSNILKLWETQSNLYTSNYSNKKWKRAHTLPLWQKVNLKLDGKIFQLFIFVNSDKGKKKNLILKFQTNWIYGYREIDIERFFVLFLPIYWESL